MEQWVVTYQVETATIGGRLISVYEFFRGSREQCMAVRSAFSGGEDDLRPSEWTVIIGPAREWEECFEEQP